jgi:hypothetical protein
MINESFRRHLSNQEFARSQRRPKQPETPGKLTVSYHIRVSHGDHLVKEFKSGFDVQEIEDPDYVEGSAADVAQVFEMLVSKPLVTAIALYRRAVASPRTGSERPELEPSQAPQPEFKAPQVPDPFPQVLPQAAPPPNK